MRVIAQVEAKYVSLLLGGDAEYLQLNSIRISLKSLKFKLFKTKGIQCAHCKARGKYFRVVLLDGKYHVNAYTKDGVMLTKDHIFPKSRGGKTVLSNLQVLCYHCNVKKGNKISK